MLFPTVASSLFATTLITIATTGVVAHPGMDLLNPNDISDLNARSPLAPRLDLCSGCCSICGVYYCCSASACHDVCPQCC